MRHDLRIFMAIQVASAILAVVSFRLIEERWQAAMVAGAGFVLVGVWMVLKTLRWPNRFRMFSFYFARLHLWLFALPMLLVRLKNFGHDFSQVHFLGVPGPTFHKVAEVVFMLMMVGTFVDLLRVIRAEHRLKTNTPSSK
ncbi:MAG: hypothetical protein AB7N80_15005 [Bdellovibrionales bacterium]